MKKDKRKQIEDNIIAIIIAFIIAYIVGAFIFDYDLNMGIMFELLR